MANLSSGPFSYATFCITYCTIRLLDSRIARSNIPFLFSRFAKSPNGKRRHILRLDLGLIYDKAIPNDLGRRESRLFHSCRINRSRDCIAHAASVRCRPSLGDETAADRPQTSQYLREFRRVPARLQVAASVSNVSVNYTYTKCPRPILSSLTSLRSIWRSFLNKISRSQYSLSYDRV